MIFSRPRPASSFQCLEVMFGTPSSVTRLLLVYRPPSTGLEVMFGTPSSVTRLLLVYRPPSTGLEVMFGTPSSVTRLLLVYRPPSTGLEVMFGTPSSVTRLLLVYRPPSTGLEVMFGTPSSVTRLLLVYRPPSTGRRGISFRTFMAEFTNLLEFLTAQLTGIIILADFNIHYGKAGNKDSNDFFDLLHATNLQQHVRRPTHTIGNILDLVITPSSGSVVTSATVGSLLTDHHAVHCLLQAPKPDRTKKQISYRKYAAINSTKFRSDF